MNGCLSVIDCCVSGVLQCVLRDDSLSVSALQPGPHGPGAAGSGPGSGVSCCRVQSGPGAQPGVQGTALLHVRILSPAVWTRCSQMVCIQLLSDIDPLLILTIADPDPDPVLLIYHYSTLSSFNLLFI